MEFPQQGPTHPSPTHPPTKIMTLIPPLPPPRVCLRGLPPWLDCPGSLGAKGAPRACARAVRKAVTRRVWRSLMRVWTTAVFDVGGGIFRRVLAPFPWHPLSPPHGKPVFLHLPLCFFRARAAWPPHVLRPHLTTRIATVSRPYSGCKSGCGRLRRGCTSHAGGYRRVGGQLG